MADADWSKRGAEGGDGVTFDEFLAVLEDKLSPATASTDYALEVRSARTMPAPPPSPRLRQALVANEASDHDLILIYFNQGVLDRRLERPAHLADRRLRPRAPTGR